MKVSIFSTKSYDRRFFTAVNTQHQHDLTFLELRLNRQTACLATNATAICVLFKVLAYDLHRNPECETIEVEYVDLFKFLFDRILLPFTVY